MQRGFILNTIGIDVLLHYGHLNINSILCYNTEKQDARETFSILYKTIPHLKLKERLKELIQLM